MMVVGGRYVDDCLCIVLGLLDDDSLMATVPVRRIDPSMLIVLVILTVYAGVWPDVLRIQCSKMVDLIDKTRGAMGSCRCN